MSQMEKGVRSTIMPGVQMLYWDCWWKRFVGPIIIIMNYFPGRAKLGGAPTAVALSCLSSWLRNLQVGLMQK